MFSKILIANRGEIACRIMRTAKAMGIKTVAVYSEADADALHVRQADEAVAIGPAPSAESYLVVDRILEAIEHTGAEAVHPGYGFLSENATFARALAEKGVAFIGPPPGAIAAMGDKIESKKLAAKSGVTVIPGHVGEIADSDEALGVARDIGYPVMIKASAGGGGKGMRVAYSDEEVAEGFRAARSEARSSFGDDRIFIEKFVEQPRHIEIQILADTHGTVLYLNERECSVQRRHQKVIEEAPSPFVDEVMRKAMGEQAVKMARAVDYYSAGTVEFVVGADKAFYFLEMNTRLQVEHPVTELTTGLDLVEQMIRVAAGEPLGLTQDQVPLKGWAVEARVYAEDPSRGFLPSIGRLTRYREPVGMPGMRIDSGVGEGGEVSLYYDPMIAKAVAHGADRPTAISRLRDGLDAFHIRGVSHNIPFLNAALAHPRFGAGTLTTAFIAEEFPDGYDGAVVEGDVRDRLITVAAALNYRAARRAGGISAGHRRGGYRPSPEWVVALGEDEIRVTVATDGISADVTFEGETHTLISESPVGASMIAGTVDGTLVHVQVDALVEGYRLTHGGAQISVLVRSATAAALAARMPRKEPPDLSRFLLSPMPGMVLSVAVSAGDAVKAGEELCIVDAMKMENVLRAERDGTIAIVSVAAGDSVAVDQVMIEFA